jgi:hypothetical protein
MLTCVHSFFPLQTPQASRSPKQHRQAIGVGTGILPQNLSSSGGSCQGQQSMLHIQEEEQNDDQNIHLTAHLCCAFVLSVADSASIEVAQAAQTLPI